MWRSTRMASGKPSARARPWPTKTLPPFTAATCHAPTPRHRPLPTITSQIHRVRCGPTPACVVWPSTGWGTCCSIYEQRPRGCALHTGLRERGFGIFEGQTYAQISQDWPEESRRWRQRDPHFAPQGGETLTQLRERIHHTVNILAEQHIGEQIVLVAHGGVMDALYRLATGQDIESPRTWDLGNAAINRLLWTRDGLTLVGWSDTRHLDEAALDEASA